jgi:hypothetical protein
MRKKDHTPTEGETLDISERCSIAVVYTDRPSRQRALGLCDSLAGRFGQELQLEFTWWNTRYLEDSRVAQLASDAVANSDLILFSTDDTVTLAPEVKAWLERGMRQPDDRERAFAAYLDRNPSGPGRKEKRPASSLEDYLRTVAAKARMDYLALSPVSSSEAAPARIERPRAAPSHWGINE